MYKLHVITIPLVEWIIDGYYVAYKPIILSSFIYINWNELLFIVTLVWCLQ